MTLQLPIAAGATPAGGPPPGGPSPLAGEPTAAGTAPPRPPPPPADAAARPEAARRLSAAVWAVPAALFAVLAAAATWTTTLLGPDAAAPALAVVAAGLPTGLFWLLRTRERERRRAAEQAEVLEALNRIAAALATQSDPVSRSPADSGAGSPAGGSSPGADTLWNCVVAGVAVGHAPAPGTKVSLADAVRENFGRQLVELAEVSRRLLRMDRAGVLLLDEPADALELLADAGDMPPGRPQTYPLADLPACRRALETGGPIFDGAADGAVGDPARPVNRQMLATFRAGAVALIPLVVRGEKVGLLTVSSTAGRAFADADRQLARALGSHAGLILTQARLSAGMAAALSAQRRLAAQRDAAAKQRDALWEVTAAAFEASTLRQSLDRIVELAPRALNVRRCTIAEVTHRPDEMVVVATTGGLAAGRSVAPFSVRGRPGGRALATGRPVVVEYARDDLGAVPWAGSGPPPPPGGRVYLPLLHGGPAGPGPGAADDGPAVADGPAAGDRDAGGDGDAGGGRAYGVMGLTRDRPGPFDPEQLALAELFAARAAAAIERAKLRERTEDLLRQTNALLAKSQQDAADRAMLLRELNHRVKNNLAGIVGLLTARPPGLDRGSPAWAWLDRVADRVRTVAETHELFVGGTAAVPLSDLVDRVVRSLPTPDGPAIDVRVDLDPFGSVMFETGLAVGVAMVLHELCFNAIIHGLGGGGTLAITARQAEGAVPPADLQADPAVEPAALLVLSVEDDGSTAGPDLPAGRPAGAESSAALRPGGTGLGLTLVRGLVGRELHGTFSMTPRPSGGTVARVTFPLPGPPASPGYPRPADPFVASLFSGPAGPPG